MHNARPLLLVARLRSHAFWGLGFPFLWESFGLYSTQSSSTKRKAGLPFPVCHEGILAQGFTTNLT